ncbi:hypothetical protein V2A60_008344 [Cordyceps javanica]
MGSTEINSDQLPLSGYLDRFSAFPGEHIDGYVSTQCNEGNFNIRLQRVLCADANPGGPGMQFETVGEPMACKGSFQPISIGSYAQIPLSAPLTTSRTWCLSFSVRVVPNGAACLFSDEAQSCDDKLKVFLSRNAVLVEDNHGATYKMHADIAQDKWYRLFVATDLERQTLRIGLGGQNESMHYINHEMQQGPGFIPCPSYLMLAAQDYAQPKSHFTGRIEGLRVMDQFLQSWPGDIVDVDVDYQGSIIGAWDFSIGIESNTIHDTGPFKFHGTLYNQPTRAVPGSNWTGLEHQWRHAPDEYAAIHFHDDDLEDCQWSRTFRFHLPENLRSGCYVLELTAGSVRDWLPFWVRPSPRKQRARLLFLVPTFTYLAYANGRLSNKYEACQQRNLEWSGTTYASDLYPTYGCSIYDTHKDGSGVCFASRLRPLLTVRPGFVSLWDAHGSGVRHFPADSHLTAWLETKGFDFDVLTDEDLHTEGFNALDGYQTVITGTHPEYHTACTLNALSEYVSKQGRLAYMGGNGFYWKIAHTVQRPHLIEMRRAEGGIRTWAAESGEYFNALDGEMGGLWRRNGRIPQRLVGVGFSTQGPFASGHYRRTEISYSDEWNWVFDGVQEPEFGQQGLSGGGAAGFELDRAESKFGSPGSTAILATSTALPQGYVPCYEELLTDQTTITGDVPRDLIRGDMCFSQAQGGGMVFAASSITFCGSLWDGHAFGGPVSQILENVLRRFLDSQSKTDAA